MIAIRNDTLAVSTTSIEVCADMEGKPPRSDLIIRNNSPSVLDIITISIGSIKAVAGSGIILKQGEVWMNSTDISNPCWQGQIQAICATVNGVLAIMEK